MIRGRLVGTVRGRRVELQPTAHVEGDLLHQNLAMEHGAYFEGESRRSEYPLSAVPDPTQQQQVVEKRTPERGDGRRSSSTFVRPQQESDSI